MSTVFSRSSTGDTPVPPGRAPEPIIVARRRHEKALARCQCHPGVGIAYHLAHGEAAEIQDDPALPRARRFARTDFFVLPADEAADKRGLARISEPLDR